MPLPSFANLEYDVTPTNLPATAVDTAMAAVVLYTNALTDPVLNGLLDCTVNSDATSIAGGVVKRMIQLSLGAGFFALFPTPAAWANVFNGFYKSTIAQKLSAAVQEIPVTFT
jgi:hypothetical protein